MSSLCWTSLFAQADLRWSRWWKKLSDYSPLRTTRLQNALCRSLEDFHGEVFMTNEKGCPYRTMFDRSFEKEGIDSITYLEFQSAEAIKQCAITGIGIAFLPEIVAEAEVERGELVALPWQIPDLHVYTQMSWHKDKWLSPIIISFIEAKKGGNCCRGRENRIA